MVQSDPYRMARDIYGVGFKTADRIAQALGLPADHPRRIEAGLLYALNENEQRWQRVCAPADAGRAGGRPCSGWRPRLIPPALERLAQSGRHAPGAAAAAGG